MTLADSLTTMLSTFVNAFVWAAEVLLATVLLVALTALVCLALRWAGNKIADKRAQLVEPETHGDDGGHPTALELYQASKRLTAVEQQRCSCPKAPQTGWGLLAGAEINKANGGVPTKGKVL